MADNAQSYRAENEEQMIEYGTRMRRERDAAEAKLKAAREWSRENSFEPHPRWYELHAILGDGPDGG